MLLLQIGDTVEPGMLVPRRASRARLGRVAPSGQCSDASLYRPHALRGNRNNLSCLSGFVIELLERVAASHFPGPFGGSGGLANFASSTGTFCFTSLTWIVNRPPGRASVQRYGIFTPSVSR